jgi:hypothetical protein
VPELESARATVAAMAARRLRSLRRRLRPAPGQLAATAAALALVALGLVRGDTVPWQPGAPPSKAPPVSVQASAFSVPQPADPFRDDPFLEVMTFRWTRRPAGSSADGAEPVLLEGRLERRLGWVRITARVVNEAGLKGAREEEPYRGELLAIAAAMARHLDDPADGAETMDGPSGLLVLDPEGGDQTPTD